MEQSGLDRVLKLLNDVECQFSISIDVNEILTSKCWICCEKQRLFWEAYVEHRKRHHRENTTGSVGAPDVMTWKLVEKWISEENGNGQSKPPDIFSEIEASLSQASLFWENLFLQVQKTFQISVEDPVMNNVLNRSSNPVDLCSFSARTTLSLPQLETRFPPYFFHEFTSDDCSITVSVKICNQCLKHVAFDTVKNINAISASCNLSTLTSHLSNLRDDAVKRRQIDCKENKNDVLPGKSNPQSKHIKLTIVRYNKKANIQNRLKPVFTSLQPITAASPVSVLSQASHPLQVVGGYSTNYTCPVSVKTISNQPVVVDSNPVAVGSNTECLDSSRLVKFKVALPPGLKSTAILNKIPGKSSLKSSTVVSAKPFRHVIGRNSPLKCSRFLNYAPQVAAKPFRPIGHLNVSSNVFPTFPSANSEKKNENVVCIRPSEHFTHLKTQDNSKSNSSENGVKNSRFSKRKSPPANGENSESSRKKPKKCESKPVSGASDPLQSVKFSKQSVTTPQKVFRNGAKTASLSPEKSKQPLSRQRSLSKSPVKRKKPDKVPMNVIVRQFLASSGAKSNETEPKKRNSAKRCRSKQRSANKLIPIPYESHYLCIHQTVAEKGWKAYWYQKCRCARVEKKKTKLLRRSPRKHVTAISKISPSLWKGSPLHATHKCPKSAKAAPDKASISAVENTPKNSNNNSSCGLPEALVEIRNTSGKASRPEASSSPGNMSQPEENPVKSVGVKIDTNMRTPEIEPCIIAFKMQELTFESIQRALGQLDTDLLYPLTVTSMESEKKSIEDTSSSKKQAAPSIREKKISCFEKHPSNPGSSFLELDSRPLSSDSLPDRRSIVDGVAEHVMEQIQCDDSSAARFSSPHFFSEYFEEFDKDPASMDIVAVDPILLQDYPDLFMEAKDAEQKRKTIQGECLKVSQIPSLRTANVGPQNDLESIWAFGRPASYFNEKQGFNAKLKRTKARFVKKPIKTIDKFVRDRVGFNYSKAKKIGKGGSSRICRHSSRRLKPGQLHRQPFATKRQINHDFEPGIGPYIIPWEIPRSSLSSVVRGLEHAWDEFSGRSGFVGMSDEVASPDSNTLTYDAINHALTAFKDSNEIFTFSSEPKDDTVLLIKRKLIRGQSFSGQNPSPKNGFPPHLHSLQTHENESSHISDSTKIVLKLRRTGEESGSAIYKVPSSPSPDGPLTSEQNSSSSNVSSASHSVINSTVAEKSCRTPPPSSECVAENAASGKIDVSQGQSLLTYPLKETFLCDLTDFCRNCSAASLDLDKETFIIDDYMHSTMINDESYFDEQSDMTKRSDGAFDLAEQASEEELEVLDWEGNIKGKDHLMELLSSLNQNSFEGLEQILLRDENLNISPLTFSRMLKSDWSNSKPNQNGRRLVDVTDTSPVESCEFDDAATSRSELLGHVSFMQNKLFSRFSTLESPEIARGNSCPKTCDEEFFPDLLSPTAASGTPIPTDTPDHISSEVHPIQRNYSGSNPPIRSCNVILEPLEDALQDFQKKKDLQEEEVASMSHGKRSAKSKTSISESSVRELNRLLKNRALNGAYWSSLDVNSSSADSSGRWRFRDRNKTKKHESPVVELEIESEDEMKEKIDEEEDESIIRYPKRKNRGKENYFRPPDADLRFFIEKSSEGEVRNEEPLLSVPSSTAHSKPSKSRLFHTLLSSEINLNEVRHWVLESTFPRPRPLRPSLVPYLKPASTRKQEESTHVEPQCITADDREAVTEDDVKKPKKEANRSSSKLHLTEEFQTLRRRLFRLRHPDYTGGLTSDAEAHPPSSRMSTRSYVKLYCVDAEQALKQDSATFSADLILGYRPNCDDPRPNTLTEPCNTPSSTVCRDTQTTSPDLRDDSEEEEAISTNQRPVIKLKDRAISSKSPQSPTRPTSTSGTESVPGSVSVSSRGRTIKPSFRNRPIAYESPMKQKRCSSTPAAPTPPPKKPATRKISPVSLAYPRRFSNKHATTGSYIKKVLESGAYS